MRCGYCKVRFNYESGLKKHLEKVHGENRIVELHALKAGRAGSVRRNGHQGISVPKISVFKSEEM